MSEHAEQKKDATPVCDYCGRYRLEYHQCSFNAYYYSFDPTGDPAIDAILREVAHAGKGAHHTEDWGQLGYVERIQQAANAAAKQRAE